MTNPVYNYVGRRREANQRTWEFECRFGDRPGWITCEFLRPPDAIELDRVLDELICCGSLSELSNELASLAKVSATIVERTSNAT